jgi:hypothetical protein
MKTTLEIRPVKTYAAPRYPTKQAVTLDHAVLRAIPVRWKAKPAVCLALALTVSSGLYGCGGTAAGTLPNKETPSVSGTVSQAPPGTAGPGENQPLALAIPIFQHGGGRGSYGCESVAPPVFLSEEEAAQVIREEAELMGVHFDGSKSIEGTFPATNLYGETRFENATWDGKLQLDGGDTALGVGFEFVSQDDVKAWQQTGDMMSSVEEYDMKGTAERLAQCVENTAVFYDPGQNWEDFKFDWNDKNADFNAYVEEYSAEQKERMLEDLREQVRDFLSWLAAEGVI